MLLWNAIEQVTGYYRSTFYQVILQIVINNVKFVRHNSLQIESTYVGIGIGNRTIY